MAVNGEQALSSLRCWDIALLLADLATAPVDGVELYERVCAGFPNLQKHFIMLSTRINAGSQLTHLGNHSRSRRFAKSSATC